MTQVKTSLAGQRPRRKNCFSLSMTHYNQKSACFTPQYFFVYISRVFSRDRVNEEKV